MGRAPLDTSAARPPTEAELQIAVGVIRRAMVLEPLSALLDSDVGRPRTISLIGILVAAQLNALARHHRGHLVEVARVLNALTDEQRDRLGICDWDHEQAYDRVERLFLRIAAALDEGHCLEVDGRNVRLDATWFVNRLARASVPRDLRESSSVAVDGTDLETWGALHGDAESVAPDGDAAEADQQRLARRRSRKGLARTAKVFGVGADGRKIYTADRDARAGHRSATNSRAAGPYVGYELHLAVQTRSIRRTNGIDKLTLGPEVAGVITNLALVPAGTHRADAIVPQLLDAKAAGQRLDEVVWDPGYSFVPPRDRPVAPRPGRDRNDLPARHPPAR